MQAAVGEGAQHRLGVLAGVHQQRLVDQLRPVDAALLRGLRHQRGGLQLGQQPLRVAQQADGRPVLAEAGQARGVGQRLHGGHPLPDRRVRVVRVGLLVGQVEAHAGELLAALRVGQQVREAAEELAGQRQQAGLPAHGGVAVQVEVLRGVQRGDAAQRGGGGVAAGDPGGVPVGGVLLAAADRLGDPEVQLGVLGEQLGQEALDAAVAGVLVAGLAAAGHPVGVVVGDLGGPAGQVLVGAVVQGVDGVGDRGAAGHGDAGQPDVVVGVVAELVGEHRVQLGLGQADQQRRADHQVAAAGHHAEQLGVLGDAGVDRRHQAHLGRAAHSGGLGDPVDPGPQLGLVLAGQQQAALLVPARTAGQEHHPQHRVGDGGAEQPELDHAGVEAVRVDDQFDVQPDQADHDGRREQVEPGEQRDRQQGPGGSAHAGALGGHSAPPGVDHVCGWQIVAVRPGPLRGQFGDGTAT